MQAGARTGLGGSPVSQREAEPAMIVIMLPLAELVGELRRGPEDHTPVEFVLIGSMAALDLPIDLGATPRNLAGDHAKIPQVPGEVGPEFGTVIVWMRWMAIGRRRCTSSTKAVADFIELCA
jgi:hypothetical protein